MRLSLNLRQCVARVQRNRLLALPPGSLAAAFFEPTYPRNNTKRGHASISKKLD
jgi:hypothetical protein